MQDGVGVPYLKQVVTFSDAHTQTANFIAWNTTNIKYNTLVVIKTLIWTNTWHKRRPMLGVISNRCWLPCGVQTTDVVTKMAIPSFRWGYMVSILIYGGTLHTCVITQSGREQLLFKCQLILFRRFNTIHLRIQQNSQVSHIFCLQGRLQGHTLMLTATAANTVRGWRIPILSITPK